MELLSATAVGQARPLWVRVLVTGSRDYAASASKAIAWHIT